MIAVDGDPRTDVDAYDRLRLVLSRGRRVDPEPVPPLPAFDPERDLEDVLAHTSGVS